jgi:recombination protein RecT
MATKNAPAKAAPSSAPAKDSDRTVDDSKTFLSELHKHISEIRAITPKYVNLTRLLSLAIEARKNPMLQKSSLESVLYFCKKCAEWGTDRVGAGGVWPVPFWSTKLGSYEMTPIPDWRFLVEKTKKGKAISHGTAEVVYENDEFYFERGLNPVLKHIPTMKDRGKLKAAYFVYTLPDGTKDFVVMDWEKDIHFIRDRTNAYKAYLKDKTKNCIWVTDEAEMGKKTVAKRGLKIFEGASPELTDMLAHDNLVNGFDTNLDPSKEIGPPIKMPEAITGPITPPETEKPTEDPAATNPEPATDQKILSLIDQAAVVIGENGPAVTEWCFDTKKIKTGESWQNAGESVLNTIIKSGKGFIVMVNSHIDKKNQQ